MKEWSTTTEKIIRTESLKKYYRVKRGVSTPRGSTVKAVDSVDLEITSGETLGLVGESGCGKSTLGQLVLNLEAPSAGSVFFRDRPITGIRSRRLKIYRREMQIVFQDPVASLNPRKTVESILIDPFRIHGLGTKAERHQWVAALLDSVEMTEEALKRYPHEFSGGQRQRICIARALALNPAFVVCDEVTSALDVSIQAQILNLLMKLQTRFKLTYLFISHNLNVVKHISDRIAVMYLGRIIEIAQVRDLLGKYVHPYTAALLYANPDPDPFAAKEKIILMGEIPSAIEPPSGCHFHPRCSKRLPVCNKRVPELRECASGHFVRCFLFE
jgi:peptide/nickel transport system ATP-binding protein/oligopeptide transport system ATP-binding protein